MKLLRNPDTYSSSRYYAVIPTKVGIPLVHDETEEVPACAGMTDVIKGAILSHLFFYSFFLQMARAVPPAQEF